MSVQTSVYSYEYTDSTLIASNSKKNKSRLKTKSGSKKKTKSKRTTTSGKAKSWEDMVRYYIASRQYRRAHSILMDRVNKRLDNEVVYYLLGQIATLNQDYKTAVGYYKKSGNYIEPESAYEYGLAYYNVKNYYKAAYGFSSVDKNSSIKNIASFYAGVCFLELNNLNQAERYFRSARHLPVKYADLKERYLEAIHRDKGYGHSAYTYTSTSRMPLPQMKGITDVRAEDPDSKKEKEDGGIESGFNFGYSVELAADIGGKGGETTYNDTVEQQEFSFTYGAGGEGRVQPMYIKRFESGRDLTVGFPLTLGTRYQDVLRSEATSSEVSPMDKVKFTLGFNPYLSVPIGKESSIGAKNDLSIEMQGTNSDTMKLNNFSGVEFKTKFSDVRVLTDLGVVYGISGIMVKETKTASGEDSTKIAASGTMGISGGLNVNADIGSWGGLDSILSFIYNMQSDENLSQAVTNDMIIYGKAGLSFNVGSFGGEVSADFTKNVPNEKAPVEGTKMEYALNLNLNYNLLQILDLSALYKHTIYPEYVYQNQTGYQTSSGSADSVKFKLNVTLLTHIKLGASYEYIMHNYGIDDEYAPIFYSREKNHSLTQTIYEVFAGLVFNF